MKNRQKEEKSDTSQAKMCKKNWRVGHSVTKNFFFILHWKKKFCSIRSIRLLRICSDFLFLITKEFFQQLFSNFFSFIVSCKFFGAIKMHSIFHEKFYHDLDHRIPSPEFWRVHKFSINWLIIWDSFFFTIYDKLPNQHTFRKSKKRDFR